MLTILTSHKTILKVALCVTLCIVSAYFGHEYGSNKEKVKLLEYQNAQKALLLKVEKDNRHKILSLQKDKENAIKDLYKRNCIPFPDEYDIDMKKLLQGFLIDNYIIY